MKKNSSQKQSQSSEGLSPFELGVGFAALAGAGYLLWKNRAQVQTFFEENLATEKLEDGVELAGNFIQDVKEKATGVLYHGDANDSHSQAQSEQRHMTGDSLKNKSSSSNDYSTNKSDSSGNSKK